MCSMLMSPCLVCEDARHHSAQNKVGQRWKFHGLRRYISCADVRRLAYVNMVQLGIVYPCPYPSSLRFVPIVCTSTEQIYWMRADRVANIDECLKACKLSYRVRGP